MLRQGGKRSVCDLGVCVCARVCACACVCVSGLGVCLRNKLLALECTVSVGVLETV